MQVAERPTGRLEGQGRGARSASLFLVATTSSVLAVTRPEFVFVISLAVVLFTFVGREGLRHHATLSAVILAGTAVGVVGRLSFGLDLFPNTVHAKAADPAPLEDLRSGIGYLVETARQVPFSSTFALAGLLAGLVHFRSRPASAEKTAIKLLLSLAVSLGLFAVATGGDWMEAGRFLAVPVALATFTGLAGMRTGPSALVAAAFLLSMLADLYLVARKPHGGFPYLSERTYQPENYDASPMEARNLVHARDISFVDHVLPVLKEAAAEDGRVVVASIQAGMVPYYLSLEMGERFHFVDLFGLTSRHVHDCRGARGWGYDPYADLPALETCTGIEFDFVFDLDSNDWSRLRYMESIGCKEVFREHVAIGNMPSWKDGPVTSQFLVDCR